MPPFRWLARGWLACYGAGRAAKAAIQVGQGPTVRHAHCAHARVLGRRSMQRPSFEAIVPRLEAETEEALRALEDLVRFDDTASLPFLEAQVLRSRQAALRAEDTAGAETNALLPTPNSAANACPTATFAPKCQLCKG